MQKWPITHACVHSSQGPSILLGLGVLYNPSIFIIQFNYFQFITYFHNVQVKLILAIWLANYMYNTHNNTTESYISS